MATYSGNVLRLGAPQNPQINPGGPDSSHNEPSGPDQVPNFRAVEINVPASTGAEYAGLTLDDGMARAVVAGQPSLGWNAPNTASTPVGSGGTPAGNVPAWTAGDPHNAQVDTSGASARYGALPGSRYDARTNSVHSAGDDTHPAYLANQIGTAGTSFLERLAEFPRQIWAEPTGSGADKFVAGTNSYASSNPEGDQYAEGRGLARVHWGFQTDYFVHQAQFIDKPAQFYERRTTPVTARDPLVGGQYYRTPEMGQLAANTWITELGESVTPSGYGVAVDGVV